MGVIVIIVVIVACFTVWGDNTIPSKILPSFIEIQVSESFEFAIPENPSTGYTLRLLEESDAYEITSEYVAYSHVRGSGGVRVFKVKGVKATEQAV